MIRDKITWDAPRCESWVEQRLEDPDPPWGYPSNTIHACALNAAWAGEPIVLAFRYGDRHVLMLEAARGRVERGETVLVDAENGFELW